MTTRAPWAIALLKERATISGGPLWAVLLFLVLAAMQSALIGAIHPQSLLVAGNL